MDTAVLDACVLFRGGVRARAGASGWQRSEIVRAVILRREHRTTIALIHTLGRGASHRKSAVADLRKSECDLG